MELTYPHELIKITENLTSAEETSDKQLKDLISFLSYMSKGKNKQIIPIKRKTIKSWLKFNRFC